MTQKDFVVYRVHKTFFQQTGDAEIVKTLPTVVVKQDTITKQDLFDLCNVMFKNPYGFVTVLHDGRKHYYRNKVYLPHLEHMYKSVYGQPDDEIVEIEY